MDVKESGGINKWITLLLSLCLIACGVSKNTVQRKPYNVLFISVDDLNIDIAPYGHPLVKTPNLDRLAKRGVVFERAYCQYPLCSPSRSSMLTGLRPDEIKVYNLTTHFRETVPEIITLPQLFKQHGYYTARVGKIYHFGVPGQIGTNGLDDSISWNKRINPKGRDKTEEAKVINFTPKRGLGSSLSYLVAEGSDEDQTDGMVASEAIELMKQHRKDPFFLAVGFYRPHCPFIAPRKYFDMYPPQSIKLPEVPANDLSDIPDAALFTKPANWGLSTDQQKQSISAYYATISFMDAQVGKLLNELDRLNLAKNTIIVFWSDHGYNLGQHGQWMKMSLFENSARVPLIISVPQLTAIGKTSKRTVELLDVYPTLAELCKLPVSHKLSGKSLKPLLLKPDAGWDRPAYTQVKRENIVGRSVRTERWRYTKWEDEKKSEELYDHEKDAGEIYNVAARSEYAIIKKQLGALLK